jgi:xanthine dehydrogenase YagR molybdenum-binding subunit
VGSALTDTTVVDPRFGHYSSHDIAEHHVPVHADVPALEVHFLPERDDETKPLKIEELNGMRICGAGAAMANASYDASGVRLRDYPLTLDEVIAKRGRAA